MRIVVALGGNALLRRDEPADVEHQRANVAAAAEAIAAMAVDHEVVVTHGNGPQVGLLALQSAALADTPPSPLDVLGAQTEGMIGYLLELELRNQLPGREVATLLTQVTVDAQDPAFGAPTKPIGPWYPPAEAERLTRERGWRFTTDRGQQRRVVASPAPVDIVGRSTIAVLLEAGTVVICAGGGGIPVGRDAAGRLHGVEAVIDKDRTSARVAAMVGADALVLLTDVEGIMADWGTPRSRLLRCATPDSLRDLGLDPGSMGPKAEAAACFVSQSEPGRWAAIGSLDRAGAVIEGTAGTRVTADVAHDR